MVVISILPVQAGAFLFVLKCSSYSLVIISYLQGSLHLSGPQNTLQPTLCDKLYISDVLGSSC